MSERYKKIYELPKNLYATGSPVVVSAGALLQDNQSNKMLVQLKIKSVSNFIIKGVKLEIVCRDIADRIIDDRVVYQYLDLEVHRREEFGQKIPIYLKDNTTRAFSVNIIEVILSDNQIWNHTHNEFEPLSPIEELNFDNIELAKQYQLRYGEKSKFIFFEEKDLWICSCGEINTHTEQQCTMCAMQYNDIKSYDVSALEDDMRKRLEQEKAIEKEKEKEKAEAEKIKIKRKKTIMKVFALGIIIVCGIGQFTTSTMFAQVLINQGGEKAVKGLTLLDFTAEYKNDQVIITGFDGDVLDVVIPNGVDVIGNSAFQGRTSLKEITIPDSVTSIGESIFRDCKSLEEITIPNSVAFIGNFVFRDCISLKEIIIPDSVTSIGSFVFQGCTSLKEITIPNSVTFIGESIFRDCKSLETITVDNKEGSVRNLTNDKIPSNAKIIWLR